MLDRKEYYHLVTPGPHRPAHGDHVVQEAAGDLLQVPGPRPAHRLAVLPLVAGGAGGELHLHLLHLVPVTPGLRHNHPISINRHCHHHPGEH